MKTKRRKSQVPMVDAQALFEKTVVAMCKDVRCHRRFDPADIDVIVRAMVTEFGPSLEEFSVYIENEDWDELCALAAREQTMRILRGTR